MSTIRAILLSVCAADAAFVGRRPGALSARLRNRSGLNLMN